MLDSNIAAASVDPDDQENNPSANAHLRELTQGRLSRRGLLKGSLGAFATAALGPVALTACGGGDDDPPPSGPNYATALGFTAVNKSLADSLVVPAGYTATVLYATGDALDGTVGAYKNDGTDGNFARRAGDHHDAIEYFGLAATGNGRDLGNASRGLLVMNHENIAGTVQFMHPAGQSNAGGGNRPEAEAIKEIEAHGVSVVEIAKGSNGRFAAVSSSALNFRVTASTPVDLNGPVRGSDFVKTAYSTDGTRTRGTINNCAAGRTPWGTYLTCEENWAGYFRRAAGDDAARSPAEVTALKRVGLTQGTAGNNRWTSVMPADAASTEFSRWDASVTGASATADFRNAPNTFGYPVEINPYDKTAVPRKRTALGRFAHEGATHSNPVAGQPLSFYMGDDSRGEYVYKFVTEAVWDPADASPTDPMAVGNKYLDKGTLYVAKFDVDQTTGAVTGTWLPLTVAALAGKNAGGVTFPSLADICVNTRLAADAAGATKMDRPEWTAVNPRNGEMYVTCTENPDRGNIGNSSNNLPNPGVDGANPRYWLDNKLQTNNVNLPQKGNVNGHVVRLRETGSRADATTFDWDIFLFAAQAQADAGLDNTHYQANVNLSGLTAVNDLSKPDGLWFSPTTGILWVETDDNTYTDVTNCQLLACIPGNYGDGQAVDVVNKATGSPNTAVTTDVTVKTRMGRKMSDAIFKRFLVAPKGSEVTGVTESPDGRALFINIQHPGENTGNPTNGVRDGTATSLASGVFESNWPGNGAGIAAPFGPGGAAARPRSATVMITKDDGGLIGV